jgi:hypothetical protein
MYSKMSAKLEQQLLKINLKDKTKLFIYVFQNYYYLIFKKKKDKSFLLYFNFLFNFLKENIIKQN